VDYYNPSVGNDGRDILLVGDPRDLMAKTRQVAALPWRQGEHGVEILLVTTRTTKRWVIPKGWTMPGKADHEAAAIEAFEEAGVRGETDTLPVGHFGYFKIMDSGKPRHVTVGVFVLKVEEELQEWPERHERERRWVSLKQVRSVIGEAELLPVMVEFERQRIGGAVAPERSSNLFGTLKKWWRWLID
jgi:8-oxo-dGTP pyrophosphatase MutT (NUDIX family)